MDRTTELGLIDELLELREAKSFFLDEAVTSSPIARYTSADRFQAEQHRIMRRFPRILALSSELPDKHAFLRRDLLRIAGAS